MCIDRYRHRDIGDSDNPTGWKLDKLMIGGSDLNDFLDEIIQLEATHGNSWILWSYGTVPDSGPYLAGRFPET